VLCIRGGEGRGGKEGGMVSRLTLLSSSKYLSCRSVIYHGPCPLKDFNSGRRPPFGERFSISVTHWDSQKANRAVRYRLISEFLSGVPVRVLFQDEHIPLVAAKEIRATPISNSDYLIRLNGSKANLLAALLCSFKICRSFSTLRLTTRAKNISPSCFVA